MSGTPELIGEPTVTPDGRLSRACYEQSWQALMASGPVSAHYYLTYHRERFYELFDHVARYLQGNPSPRLLEIGVSAFSKLYKVFFPHIRFVTVDRPVALHGVDAAFTLGECGAEQHYGIDLNREPIGPDYGEPPLGSFDYVIFSEVLEHLTVNPVQLFGELLSLLAPNGLLFLTTPNFFSHNRLRQLAVWDNPQEIFPRRGQDRDASFHFREYTMSELIDFFEQAGGGIVKAYFSDCWDDPSAHALLERTPQFCSNLALVVCRADAEMPRSASIAQWRQFAKPADESLHSNLLWLQAEVKRLQETVEGYERGRFMRLMKWLHKRTRFRL